MTGSTSTNPGKTYQLSFDIGSSMAQGARGSPTPCDAGTDWCVSKRFEGVIPNCERRLLETSSEMVRAELRNYQRRTPCKARDGSRLRLERGTPSSKTMTCPRSAK